MVDPREDLADPWIAAGLDGDFQAEHQLCLVVVLQLALDDGDQAVDQIVGTPDRLEGHKGFAAFVLRQSLEDRVLGADIVIEVRRAHTGLGGDVGHGRTLQAFARKDTQGRFEDAGAAVGMQVGIGAAHDYRMIITMNEYSVIVNVTCERFAVSGAESSSRGGDACRGAFPLHWNGYSGLR